MEESKLRPDHAVEEVWFAGVHSDVGDGFLDDRGLANISLKWIVEGGLQRGLFLVPGTYKRWCSVTRDDALGKVHKMRPLWILTGRRQRIIPPDAKLHQSVAERMASMPRYASFGDRSFSFADPHWLSPFSVDPTRGFLSSHNLDNRRLHEFLGVLFMLNNCFLLHRDPELWHLIFKGVAAYNGDGDPIDVSKAERIAKAFRPPLSFVQVHSAGSTTMQGSPGL